MRSRGECRIERITGPTVHGNEEPPAPVLMYGEFPAGNPLWGLYLGSRTLSDPVFLYSGANWWMVSWILS